MTFRCSTVVVAGAATVVTELLSIPLITILDGIWCVAEKVVNEVRVLATQKKKKLCVSTSERLKWKVRGRRTEKTVVFFSPLFPAQGTAEKDF